MKVKLVYEEFKTVASVEPLDSLVWDKGQVWGGGVRNPVVRVVNLPNKLADELLSGHIDVNIFDVHYLVRPYFTDMDRIILNGRLRRKGQDYD